MKKTEQFKLDMDENIIHLRLNMFYQSEAKMTKDWELDYKWDWENDPTVYVELIDALEEYTKLVPKDTAIDRSANLYFTIRKDDVAREIFTWALFKFGNIVDIMNIKACSLDANKIYQVYSYCLKDIITLNL